MFQQLRKAFHKSVPVLFGYLPLGAAFGVLWSTLDLPWYFTALSGLIVYAGAAQFLSVSLLASHTPLIEIFFATFLLNIRHIFYGFSFLKRYRSAPLKPYLIFGLTDETYSLLTANRSTPGDDDKRFCLSITFLNQIYWVLGCAIGGIIGAAIKIETRGFEFVLTALFVVLAVEQWRAVKKPFPFVVGGMASLLALFFKSQFLLIAIGTTTLSLLLIALKDDSHVE